MDTPETNEHPKDADQNVEQLPAAVERLRPAINDSAGSEHCAKKRMASAHRSRVRGFAGHHHRVLHLLRRWPVA